MKAAKRSGKKPMTPNDARVVIFTSRGAVGGSSELGNFVYNLNTAGAPFTGSQLGKFTSQPVSIDLRKYFAEALFNAYEYYRFMECETTFSWTKSPNVGTPIAAELLWAFDKDSRAPVPLSNVANRSDLQTRTFTNNEVRHVVKWNPYLVETSETEGVAGKQIDYTHPRTWWLNTDQSDLHRFGTLRFIASNFDSTGYPTNNPSIEVRHRVKVEFKGLRTVQAAPGITSPMELHAEEATS
jgi:hypothetical protein